MYMNSNNLIIIREVHFKKAYLNENVSTFSLELEM